MPPEPKRCRSCGRTIAWRKKWARDWDQVRYCSSACRRRGVGDVDRRLEQTILDLLAEGRRGASIGEADAARVVAGDDDEALAALREPLRRAARRLVERGEVVLVQGGRVVDPSTARGAIRIRRA